MSSTFLSTLGLSLSVSAMGAVGAIGISMFYVRYLRKKRAQAVGEKDTFSNGFLIIGIIVLLFSLVSLVVFLQAFPISPNLFIFLVALLLFTALYAFVARHSYKRSI